MVLRILPLSVVAALLFAYVEWLTLYRSALWTGAVAGDCPSILLGFFVYAAVLAGLGGGLASGLRALGKTSFAPETSLIMGCVLGAIIVWGVQQPFRGHAPFLHDLVILGAFIGLGMFVWAAEKTGLMRFGAAVGGLATMLLCAIAALFAAHDAFLLDPARASKITMASVAWAMASGVVALLLWQGGAVRRILSLALAALPFLVAALWTGGKPTDGAAESHPNVVLIVADSLRADSIEAEGFAPNLHGLARRGARYEQYYALAPWTLPSMSGLFTSSYPPGVTPGRTEEEQAAEIWEYRVPTSSVLLAERFKAAGYDTCALVANPVLRGMPGILRGFGRVCFSHHLIPVDAGPLRMFPRLSATLSSVLPGLEKLRFQDTTRDLNHYALRYLRARRKAPFFLWIHYMDPHAPYDPPGRFRAREGPWPLFWPYPIKQYWGCPLVASGEEIGEDDKAYVRSLYDAEAAYVDWSAGLIVDTLNRLGLGDNTLICFTSDHGESFWEKGRWGHGHSLDEELIRVPLVIAGPGIEAQTVDGPVSAIDLAPTLGELAGLESVDGWLGESWAPVLTGRGPEPAPRPAYARATIPLDPVHPLETVVSGDRRLIRDLETGESTLRAVTGEGEGTEDLAASEPEEAEHLSGLLDAWNEQYPSTIEESYGTRSGARGDVQSEHLGETLRSVGYL